MLDLSIIVVSYNTRNLTLACLRSVYEQTCEVRFEVLVVDNASADGSASAIAAEFPDVRLFALDRNLGFAAGNNYAARYAMGQWLLLLNPDTVILDRAIDKLVTFAESKPRAGVIGGRAVRPDGTLQFNCFEPAGLLNLLITTCGLHRVNPGGRFCGRERLTHWDYLTARPVPVVAGCFMLVRRAAIVDVGLMDERFFMYAEEMDWCVRFAAAAWEVWYAPEPTIMHWGGASAAQAPLHLARAAKASLLLFLQKYHGRAYVTLCRAVLLLGLVLRAPLRIGRALPRGSRRLRDEFELLAANAALYSGFARS